MDLDIGKIDRIQIWHDNSGTSPAWFLDSVIIRKMSSTCSTVSNIYVQRLEQITQILHRQIHEQMKKESIVRHGSGRSGQSHDYDEHGSKDRLGSSRGILRSPTMYDKASLHKKVTWDEQSIGSQDDFLSVTSHGSLPTRLPSDFKQKKEESSSHKTNPVEHQAYWISSHNYVDHQWKIASIEEMNSFYLDSTTRALLLSDRSTMNASSKTSVLQNDDEIYQCSANRWLAKDKEDGKLEIQLSAIAVRKQSLTSSPKVRTDHQYQKANYDTHTTQQTKPSLPSDLKPVEKPLRSSTSYDFRPSSSSSRNTHDLSNRIKSEQNLLARITGEPSNHSRISSNQNLRSPRNINDPITPTIIDRQSSAKASQIQLTHSRSSAISLPSSEQSIKSFRDNKDLTAPLPSSRDVSSKIARTSMSLSNQPLKSSRSSRDTIHSLSGEQELLARITSELPSHTSSLTSLHQRAKSARNINDSTNDRQLLARMSSESFKNPRLTPTSSLASKQLSQAIPSMKGSTESLSKSSRSMPKLSSQKSIYGKRNSSITVTYRFIFPFRSSLQFCIRYSPIG